MLPALLKRVQAGIASLLTCTCFGRLRKRDVQWVVVHALKQVPRVGVFGLHACWKRMADPVRTCPVDVGSAEAASGRTQHCWDLTVPCLEGAGGGPPRHSQILPPCNVAQYALVCLLWIA
jgi:hypothetical protein